MVFSSLPFMFLYLPVTLAIYYALPEKYRNFSLLVLSLVFYGWGEPFFVLIMAATVFADYAFGYLIGKSIAKGGRGKTWLVLAVIFNLGILAFFKYNDFFAGILSSAGIGFLPTLGLKLPIGISFYTFQALSYVFDIYMRRSQPQKSIVNFGAYITMFPQLVAGPIVRYSDIEEQLTHRRLGMDRFASGVSRFTAGLAKKIHLADRAGALWEYFRDIPDADRSALAAWLGIICFTFQIYFDFSAYSDMAIGLGRMIGFDFCENFNYPYMSTSATDFWRRWHISLGTWFREYVYIPLGGNRRGRARTFVNIFIVWFLTGLWHGAAWNFIIWGLYYCVLLIIEKTFLLKALEKLPRFVSRIYSLLTIVFGWLIFASDTIAAPLSYLSTMFGSAGMLSCGLDRYELARSIFLLLALAVGSTPLPNRLWHKLTDSSRAGAVISVGATAAALAVCIAYMINSSYSPFLYFNF